LISSTVHLANRSIIGLSTIVIGIAAAETMSAF
jgi:hypothetical protein